MCVPMQESHIYPQKEGSILCSLPLPHIVCKIPNYVSFGSFGIFVNEEEKGNFSLFFLFFLWRGGYYVCKYILGCMRVFFIWIGIY